MSKIELGKIRPVDMVIQREFGIIEQNGRRETFALYTVNSSQLSNWAEIEAARSHPEVARLLARAEKLAKRMTNKAHTAALAKLEARLTQ